MDRKVVHFLALDATNFLFINSLNELWKISSGPTLTKLMTFTGEVIRNAHLDSTSTHIYLLTSVSTKGIFYIKKYRISDGVLMDSIMLNPYFAWSVKYMMVTNQGVAVFCNGFNYGTSGFSHRGYIFDI